jgi:hypothetical protein
MKPIKSGKRVKDNQELFKYRLQFKLFNRYLTDYGFKQISRLEVLSVKKS